MATISDPAAAICGRAPQARFVSGVIFALVFAFSGAFAQEPRKLPAPESQPQQPEPRQDEFPQAESTEEGDGSLLGPPPVRRETTLRFFKPVPGHLQARPSTVLEEIDRDMRRIVSRLGRSVVRVDSFGAVEEGVDPLAQRVAQHFSGIVLEGGLVVTVSDALAGSERIYVKTYDGKQYPAERVGSDEFSGVAVLHVPNAPLDPVESPRRVQIDVGSLALTIGNPFGLTTSPSLGMLSGIRTMRLQQQQEPMLQVSAAINPGDYGGIVADASGVVIGMIVSSFRVRENEAEPSTVASLAGFMSELEQLREAGEDVDTQTAFFRWLDDQREADRTESEGAEPRFRIDNGAGQHVAAANIHFAMPFMRVEEIAKQIVARSQSSSWVQSGKVNVLDGATTRPWIGVRVEPVRYSVMGQRPKSDPPKAVRGLLVLEVIETGPAARAGLQRRDVITRFNGVELESPERFDGVLRTVPVGQPARIDVLRGGKLLNLAVTLSPHPNAAPRPILESAGSSEVSETKPGQVDEKGDAGADPDKQRRK